MKIKNTFRFKKKLSLQQQRFLCQQLSFALAGGLPLPGAVQLVGGEIHPVVCARFLQKISEALQQGQTMAEALKQSDIGYSPVLLEFVLAGEQNGTMQKSMEQAADYFERQNRTRQMLFSAMFYPAVLLLLMLAAFGAMFCFVVPTVVQTYETFQAELPAMTQHLIQVSGWVRKNWMLAGSLLVAGCLILFCIWRHMRKIPVWQKRITKAVLRLPVAGKLYQQYWFVQIGQAMGLMLSSGMLLSSCLEAVRQIYRRSLFAQELQMLEAALQEGYSFDMAIRDCNFVPSMARQMLAVSEQTGALPETLIQLSQYYQQQVQQRLQRMTSLLEPGFVLILGIGILLMAGSLFLPMVQSYQYLL